MAGGGATPSTWNFGSTGPRWSKIADFEPIIARSASAVTPSEKSSINANRKSTMRFPISLRLSSYVAPRSEKRKTAAFRKKIGVRLKKVCYKVSLCENCQRQSCKAFIGLTIRAKVTALERNLNNTDFQLVPTSMTLNDLERRNSPYFAFFHGIRQIFSPIISQWLKIDL